MGGFFGVASKKDCVLDLFYGIDYHSHLGTRRGGMATYGKDGYEFDSEKEVSIDFLNNISIPAGEDGVNIKFYIRLSVNASNELQGQTFKIGKINFISV